MGDVDGSFDLDGRSFDFHIISITTYDGSEYIGADIADHLDEADQVFYSAQTEGGETYYRWLGGPYEDFAQIEAAIADELGEYEETAS